MNTPRQTPRGFTLIELSIVLVIIGLIVGSVLAGQELIRSAASRAQITQIEKYNQAVNAFRSKYRGMPGDLYYSLATKLGFNVGTNCTGQPGGRDGDGLIYAACNCDFLTPASQLIGETGAFWPDLSTANLIEGTFPNGGLAQPDCLSIPNWNASPVAGLSAANIGNALPSGKIGYGTSVYVYSIAGANWYGLSAVSSIATSGGLLSSCSIPVNMAAVIDMKVDDGLPTTGNVVAQYVNATTGLTGDNVVQMAPNSASDTSSTCYNSSTNAYSLKTTQGSGNNCGLSFQFQ